MRKRLGFTLLEMLIVMVIIGILFSMTLGFGADKVRELDRQSVSDQLVDGFNSLVGQSRTSSYLYGKKYSTLLVSFLSGEQNVLATISGAQSESSLSIFNLSTFRINSIIAGQTVLSRLDVELTPYAIWCQLRSASQTFSWAIISAYVVDKISCYYLDPSLCTLKKTSCTQ